MKYWITTDTHIDHIKTIDFCNRPDDFNERIIRGLVSLKSDDILIHLGDVSWSGPGERKYLGNIPCKKWLVRGNHDRSYTYHLSIGWDWVGETMELERFGLRIKFSHKPVPIQEEDIQFHGHFHNASNDRWEKELVEILTNKHKLLVIEDMNYRPATLKSLIRWFVSSIGQSA